MNKNEVIVTGVAGFIGSHLAEKLISEGYHVTGVDCFTDYYLRSIKEKNLSALREHPRFQFIERDLLKLDCVELIKNTSHIFHLAGQPGVRKSWGADFEVYTRNNILVTQKLLEACKSAPQLKRFVFSSSSSIYGDSELMPTPENVVPMPISPYGVSKLAGEHLCKLYFRSYSIPTVTLRYFTVFGPRQRPDMGFHKFIDAISTGKEIEIYGDGEQTRSFTYVSDVVHANILAGQQNCVGEVLNIGGGGQVSINIAMKLLQRLIGISPKLKYLAKQNGDALHTSADISKANKILGYYPLTSIEAGLAAQVEWHQDQISLHKAL